MPPAPSFISPEPGDRPAAPARSVAWLAMVAVLVSAGLLVLLGMQEHRRVHRQAAADALGSASQLAEHAEKVLGIHALALQNVQWTYDVLGWERMAETPVVQRWLTSLAEQAPEVQSYWLMDPAGMVRVNSFTWPATPLDVSDRDYFTAHRDSPGSNGVYVGKPLLGRIRQDVFFTLSRGLRDGDGRFAGVAQVSLLPGYFSDFYRTVARSPGVTIMLAREDGTVLARFPETGPGPDFGRVPDLPGGPRGTVTAQADGPADGIRRLYAQVPLERLPVRVVYGVSVDTLEKEWVRRMRGSLVMVLAGLALLVPFALLAFRNARRAERAHAALLGVNSDLERRVADRTAHLDKALADLSGSEQRLRFAQEAGGVGTWDWDPDTGEAHWSETHRRIWGVGDGAEPRFERLLAAILPEDRGRVEAALAETRAGNGPLDVEFRIERPDGSRRWVLFRGELLGHRDGTGSRMTGICRDMTDRKEAEERQLLLMREVDHRAKNALAVAQAVVRLSRASTVEQLVAAVEGRISALARAHSLLATAAWAGADLRRLVQDELAPFAEPGHVLLEGPTVQLGPEVVQSVGLILHELATNAAKHGALSVPTGLVRVGWAQEGERLRLSWQEEGGPPAVEPTRKGFGSTLLSMVVRHQLQGDYRMDWTEQGLRCVLDLPGMTGKPAA